MDTPKRYDLLKIIASVITDELVICNIGFPSQELYSIRDSDNFFYMLGSMGLASSIGLGLSLSTSQQVISIDGDGSVLMNLGTLATIANHGPTNFILLIVDNGAYGSTGDQPTHTAGKTSLVAMAKGAGIESVYEVDGDALAAQLTECLAATGPHVIVAKAAPGNSKQLPIPLSPIVIRDRFRATVAGEMSKRLTG